MSAQDRDLRQSPRQALRRALQPDVWVPVVLSLAFSLFVWRKIVAHPQALTQSTGGEEGIYLWYLGHVPWAVTHAANPFITNAMNYPAGVNLLWNTSLLTPGLIFAPITELGGVVLAYNLLLVATVWLSVLTAYAACRRFVAWWPAALAGGATVAISPYLMSQARGHLNLILLAIPPLFLLVGDELLVKQRMRPVRLGVLLAFLVVLQVGCSTEILASAGALSAVGVVVLAVIGRHELSRERMTYIGKALAATVVASLIVLAVPFYYLFFGPQHLTGQAQASSRFHADLLSPLLPTGVQKIAPSSSITETAKFPGNGFENTAYLGITMLLVLIGIVVVLRRNRVVVWAAVTALVSLILSLGETLSVDGHDTGFPLPFKVLSKLPLLSSGTAVRYSYYTVVLCGLLLSVAVDRAHAATRAASLGAYAAVVVALVPLIPNTLPFRATSSAIPAFFTGAGVQAVPENSVLLTYPYLNRFQSAPMTWQALADFRYLQIGDYAITPGKNGVGVFDVTTATAYVFTRIEIGTIPGQNSTPAVAMRKELHQWDVRTIVVEQSSAHAADAVTFLTTMLGKAPTAVGGMDVFSDLHP